MKFHELTIGQKFITKPINMTQQEIVEFAEKFDPQYFHVDEDQAKESPFGTMIASGFHSIGAVWAEWIRMDILGKDCLGGLGMDDIRWTKPVLPGDQLIGEIVIEDKRLLSDEKRGIVTLGFTVKNQDEITVLTFSTKPLVAAV